MMGSMSGLVLVCMLMCVLPVAWGTIYWKVEEYPDPFSYDTYSQCGRSNKSNICDPDNLISRKQADEIDSLIWSVFRETRCLCQSCIRNSQGYVIRVAIMPRMESILKLGNTTEDKIKDAQMFAYMLTRKWAMAGHCNESLLILYSRYDGLLYTLTLPLTRAVLKDETIKRITLSVRPMFDDANTVGEGLKEMIRRYKMVFDGKEDKALRPKKSRLTGNGASRITSTSFILSFLLSGLLVAAGH